jgi:hypothetical protein
MVREKSGRNIKWSDRNEPGEHVLRDEQRRGEHRPEAELRPRLQVRLPAELVAIKRRSFFQDEGFLCLSRACLGKIISFLNIIWTRGWKKQNGMKRKTVSFFLSYLLVVIDAAPSEKTVVVHKAVATMLACYIKQSRLITKTVFFECVPYVCPEPVLVKRWYF